MKYLLYFSVCVFVNLSSAYSLETQIVATVSKEIVSSRKVRLDTLIEGLLYGVDTPRVLNLQVQEDRFQLELNRYILERIVYLESKAFTMIQVPTAEVDKIFLKLMEKIKTNKAIKRDWDLLEVSTKETKEVILQKITAQKFVEFKSKSSMLPVTEAETFSYFSNNKNKYDGKSYKDVKDLIKKDLAKMQAEQRLTDWYELLKKKYDVSRVF